MARTGVALTRTPPLEPRDAEFFAAARLRAARLQPFFATAVFALVPVVRPGLGTFAVDRWWRVYLDMDTAREWGVEATATVLLHEAHHVVRDHHTRAHGLVKDAAQAHLWNLAADAAINDDLVDDGLALPDPVLPSHLGMRSGLLEEAYYRRLRRSEEDRGGSTCGSGAGGPAHSTEIGTGPGDDPGPEDGDHDHGTEEGLDDVDAAAVRRAVAHDVVRSDERGEPVPGGLVRWARELLEPQVPWQSLLRGVLGRTVRAVTSRPHPSWTRPDRRADSRPDFPHPGTTHHLPEVAVVVDTSASMSTSLLDAAVTEVDALLRRTGVREVVVVSCDAAATRTRRVRRIGQIQLRGGGGTDLRVGIDAAMQERPTPSVVVVLTDGLTPWPTAAPPRTALVAVVIGDQAALPAGAGITALRIGAPT